MKIERINDKDYNIYYYEHIISNDNLNERVKELLKKLQRKLKLNGFYKVIVINKEIGLFFQLIHINDSFYKNNLDLKIDISNSNIYYKTKDYFIIKNSSNILYYDGYYYCVVDKSFDNILEKVEFGEFIFEEDILDIKNKTYVI